MKFIKTGVIAIAALISTAFVIPATPARAQYYPVYTCEAASPVALGIGTSPFLNIACGRALAECAVRTPPGLVCTIQRWY